MNRTLYHPDLDETVVRTERQAKVLAASGWVDVTDETEPGRNASVDDWREHLDDNDLVAAPDATRTELIDLWDARTR